MALVAFLKRAALVFCLLIGHTGAVPAVSVVAGASHTCAILRDGGVKCWGRNIYGKLGYGDSLDRAAGVNETGDFLPRVDLGSGRTAEQIAIGDSHTCVLLDNSSVKCWGFNTEGQLGYEDWHWRGDDPGEMGDMLPVVNLGTGRSAVEIGAGMLHTCALLDDASVKCWGSGQSGRLGYGDVQFRGVFPDTMGDFLPTVDLGTGRTGIQIAVGTSHTCVLLDDSSVKCWGGNSQGQLGYGDTENRGDETDEMGNFLLPVDLGSGRTAVQITAGARHTCALLDDGTAKCWGNNLNGQLGYSDDEDRGDETLEMGNRLLPIPLSSFRVVANISAGLGHTCAVLDDASLKCWGAGSSGQLGYGDPFSRGDGTLAMGDFLPTVDVGPGRSTVQVSCGTAHTCALLDNDVVKCWGAGLNGRLGYGDTDNRGDDSDEMSIFLPGIDFGSPPTEMPTSSPSTSSPSVSPTTSMPSTSPTTSAPSTSPTLRGAATFVGQTLLADNENGGGNAWTDEELRMLENQDIETLEQACLVSDTLLVSVVGLTSGRAVEFRLLFSCDGVPTPAPTDLSPPSGLSEDSIITIVSTVLGLPTTMAAIYGLYSFFASRRRNSRTSRRSLIPTSSTSKDEFGALPKRSKDEIGALTKTSDAFKKVSKKPSEVEVQKVVASKEASNV